MGDRFEELKQRHPIPSVASSLGIQAVGGRAIHCPNAEAHKNGDRNPSFVIQDKVNRFECYGCGVKGSVIDLVMLVKKCDLKDAVLFLEPDFKFTKDDANLSNDYTPKAQLKTENPDGYLQSRGLKDETIQKHKLEVKIYNGSNPRYKGRHVVKIPVPTGIRYRLINPKSGEDKYFCKWGTTPCLLKGNGDTKTVILAEGEFDKYIIEQETRYEVWTGTSGVNVFRDYWVKDFEKAEKIYIAYDNDEAGRNAAEKRATQLGIERCYRLEVPQSYGKDWTDFFLKGGSKEKFDELLKTARPFKQNLASKFEFLKTTSDFSVIPTGLKTLDGVLKGGLRTKGAYLLAGLEKSGKTAYLLTMVNSLLLNNERIGYIDTELGLIALSARLAAIYNNKTVIEVEKDNELVAEWVELFQENFQYAGLDGSGDLYKDRALDFELTFAKIEQFVNNGAKIIIVDNLTSYAVGKSNNSKQEWQILSGYMLRLTAFAKEKNVSLIFVVHTKKLDFQENPKHILKLLKENRAEEILTESVSIVRKPTLSDVYGGGQALSQISGAFLIWRPYQKFSDPKHNVMSQLILESLRDAAPATIDLTFHGDRSTFSENVIDVLSPSQVGLNTHASPEATKTVENMTMDEIEEAML